MLDHARRSLACLQAVARQGSEAVSVRLEALVEQSQAQLDGFKSRALRSEGLPAPRHLHLYLTAWAATEIVEARGGAMLLIGDDVLSLGCERASACVSSSVLVWYRPLFLSRCGSASPKASFSSSFPCTRASNPRTPSRANVARVRRSRLSYKMR